MSRPDVWLPPFLFSEMKPNPTAVPSKNGRIEIENIIREVASETGISDKMIKGRNQSKSVVQARHLAMALAVKTTGQSYTNIGKVFNKDHSTVIRGVFRAIEHFADDPVFRETYIKIYNRNTR